MKVNYPMCRRTPCFSCGECQKGYEIAVERDKVIDGGTTVFYYIYDKWELS